MNDYALGLAALAANKEYRRIAGGAVHNGAMKNAIVAAIIEYLSVSNGSISYSYPVKVGGGGAKS